MKRILVICVLGAILGLGVRADAAPSVGSWDSRNGDFDAGGWEELFLGGGTGQSGNQITASGNEWNLLASLDSIASLSIVDNQMFVTTIYNNNPDGGDLDLFAGPWGDPAGDGLISYYADMGDLTVNTTKTYTDSGSVGNESTMERIEFMLSASGFFVDYPAYLLDITGYFDSDEHIGDLYLDPGWGMFGPLTWATIEISTTNVIPAPGAILLAGMGSGLVGWLRRKRML